MSCPFKIGDRVRLKPVAQLSRDYLVDHTVHARVKATNDPWRPDSFMTVEWNEHRYPGGRTQSNGGYNWKDFELVPPTSFALKFSTVEEAETAAALVARTLNKPVEIIRV